MPIGQLEDCKQVDTHAPDGELNGKLIEAYKDGKYTLSYLTSIKPGKFKGYHLHRVRAARYFPLAGKMKIILQRPGEQEREEYILDAANPQRLYIPKDVATGLLNEGDVDAWLINLPDPPYDPDLKDEQVEYTEDDLAKGIVK